MGPTVTGPVEDPLAMLSLNNRLFIAHEINQGIIHDIIWASFDRLPPSLSGYDDQSLMSLCLLCVTSFINVLILDKQKITEVMNYLHISGESRQYSIEYLLPKTFYYIRAKAQNLAGYSDPSNVIYLQTKAPHSGEKIGSALLIF